MLRKTKLLVAMSLAAALATTSACSSSRSDSKDDNKGEKLVGISMPTKSLERWNRDGSQLEGLLKKEGYKTSLQYADNSNEQQISQIENMINLKAKVLVIAPINDKALGPVLQKAASKKIKIVSYDRLINETKNVDYYATFDNYKVGKAQGDFIVSKLGLADGKGPFNFEVFAGDPSDNNAKFFFAGAWDVLKKYVDNGKLVIQSSRKVKSKDDWSSVGITKWEASTAQNEMDNRLNSFYTGDKKINVILSPNDSLALGIAQSLDSHGYKPGPDYPILTGQDADLANTKNIIAGKQTMTVWKDTRTLADQVSKMVKAILEGKKVDVNDTNTYNNGVKTVPSYLLPTVVITADNVKKELVESNFYKASELGLS